MYIRSGSFSKKSACGRCTHSLNLCIYKFQSKLDFVRLSLREGMTYSPFSVLYSKNGVHTSTIIFNGCFIFHYVRSSLSPTAPLPPFASSLVQERSSWRRERRSSWSSRGEEGARLRVGYTSTIYIVSSKNTCE
jgi:hypothetical protein